ncbi:ANTAR domain-containing protein [Sporichthya sp.]|uniref:ANTAR domain-containing protein n=1 Tax=Sporichthya sp. TaxID=65475 RepID=UPI00182BD42D|nr:ANTAR domain-containing protein [Sporichthya sp.]MBA3742622.1 ANTAR domain-containing protein [Sporichthya sp.]
MPANDYGIGAAAPRPGDTREHEDVRLRRVHEHLDQVARSLQDLGARADTDRETAEPSIDGLHAQLAELQAELDGLRTAMRNRGVIEQAKGMLMVRLRVDEGKAFDYLRTLSNTTNRKLSEVAGEVVRTRAGESDFPLG